MKMTSLETLIGRAVGETKRPLSRLSIEAYQSERLCRLIDYCRANSPFYRKKLATVGDAAIKGLGDLTRLPLTSEEELRSHGAEMVCVSQDAVARIITMQSSGTTGMPKRLFFTDQDLERTLDFFHLGMEALVDPGQTVAIMLPGATPDSTGYLLAKALKRRGVASEIIGLVTDPKQAAKRLGDIRADVLVGFPVQLLAIARMAEALSLSLGSIRSVLLCSDYVPDSLRAQLAGLLGCEIFTHYGTVETGLGGGVDCAAHCGSHLREADLLFEIIDPLTAAPLADGCWGEIVFTTLSRDGMPLIRYRTGDKGRIIAGPCPCGSHIRRLDKVLGRINQVRKLKNGDPLALHSLDELLFAIPGLLDFRAVLAGEQKGEQLNIACIAVPGSEETTSRQATARLNDMLQKRQLEVVLTLDTTAGIHPGKRILRDNRQERLL